MKAKQEKIIVGDEIEVITPIGRRVWKVEKISDCGKWAITEGKDYFRITVDPRGFTKKRGHRDSCAWYSPSWRVLRFVDHHQPQND